MIKKVSFYGIWVLALIGIAWFLISFNEWNWVLLIYVPLLLSIVFSSFVAMNQRMKKVWIVNIVIGSISLLVSVVLLFFIDDLFDYDGGGMFPGFAYFTERVYSILAAIVFEISIFVSLMILLVQQKRMLLVLLTILVEVVIVGAFILSAI